MEVEAIAGILGGRAQSAGLHWPTAGRGAMTHESDLSKWGGWYEDAKGKGFAIASSNLVDTMHAMMTGSTGKFKGQKWNMVWGSNQSTGTLKIGEGFEVSWASSDNQLNIDGVSNH